MEFDDVIVKENPGLCRCCLSEGCYKELATEYIWMGENEVYADMLLECFDISISQNNEGPNGTNRLICEVCITRLRDACNFKKQVLECEKKFVDMVGRGDFKQSVTVDILFEDNLKLEQNAEDQSQDTGNFDFMEEPMAFDDEINDDVTAEPLPVKGKRGRPKKSIKTVKKKEEKPKTSKAKEQEEIPTFEDFKIGKPERLTSKEKRNIMRNNVLQVLIKSTVMPFRWLKSCYRCFYCYDIFTEPSELKSHQHQHTGDDIKESTMNKYWEQVVYIDVSTLSCKLCSDDIPDLYDLINHLVEKHSVVYNKDVGICMIPFKLDNYSLNCLTCGATFYTFGTLLHHTNKDHKGTSATLCEICGQNFKDANLLRLHVKAIHDSSSLLCQECGEKFESRYKLKNHQKYEHELYKKKYKCLVCDETFRSHYKRSRHMVEEHKNREVIKCLHCPKTFVFRSMMMTHLRDAHLKVRNHVCSVCGWKAFTSHRLKNHMYKHSGEKNFRCDGCDKMFTTRKIMKAHFSRMHKGVPIKNVYEEPYQY
ncbi:zinc finger protein 728-like isoform X7 [Pieris brassicae]|uniref:zinc finger protein 728-like isoform X7 n=1 Tax=Pieris brassicae TaxID=7116 RepID=UPI001E660518|nr:zinc finger protein 728-like isoform X7 [Pieris brassicae]